MSVECMSPVNLYLRMYSIEIRYVNLSWSVFLRRNLKKSEIIDGNSKNKQIYKYYILSYKQYVSVQYV
jgi:hypothetical protein